MCLGKRGVYRYYQVSEWQNIYYIESINGWGILGKMYIRIYDGNLLMICIESKDGLTILFQKEGGWLVNRTNSYIVFLNKTYRNFTIKLDDNSYIKFLENGNIKMINLKFANKTELQLQHGVMFIVAIIIAGFLIWYVVLPIMDKFSKPKPYSDIDDVPL